MIKELIEKEVKKIDRDSWKKQEAVHYEVLIYRENTYFRKRFIDREHGLLENPTVEEIKSFATGSIDKVFKITTIQERIK